MIMSSYINEHPEAGVGKGWVYLSRLRLQALIQLDAVVVDLLEVDPRVVVRSQTRLQTQGALQRTKTNPYSNGTLEFVQIGC